MKHFIIIALATLLVACSSENTAEQSTEDIPQPNEVKYFGALKSIMHEGDLTAKADLKDLEGLEHVYALGALENLKGEIQIFDGQSYTSYVSETNELMIDPSYEKKVTLLVYAQVEEWVNFPIPEDVVTKDDLEAYIAATAEANGIDIHQPFPFLLDGNAAFIDWHVINWKDGDTEHSHEKHIQSGLHGTLIGEDAKFLGFYSDAHHAIFTHHTTNMHIHVKTKDNMVAGHVDDLELNPGMMTLRLPKN